MEKEELMRTDRQCLYCGVERDKDDMAEIETEGGDKLYFCNLGHFRAWEGRDDEEQPDLFPDLPINNFGRRRK